jgi:hypothetical protein
MFKKISIIKIKNPHPINIILQTKNIKKPPWYQLYPNKSNLFFIPAKKKIFASYKIQVYFINS